MAPRGSALPQATTESAREARKAFFCELCQKGYARMNDFEAHEGSYDHQHRKRLKEMKQLTKDPNAAAKAREAERNEAGLKSVSLSLSGAGSAAKKKPVFKSTLQPHNAAVLGQPGIPSASGGDATIEDADEDWLAEYHADPTQMKVNGWESERYDPRFPAGDCALCRGRCRGDCKGVRYDRSESYETWAAKRNKAQGGRLSSMASAAAV